MVFDFSGVLVTSAFSALTDVLGDQLEPAEAMLLLLGPYDEDTDHPWHQVERGELTMAEWIAHVDVEAAARGVTVDWTAMGRGFKALEVYDVVVDRIRALRVEGYLTALLTNNIKEGSQTWRAMIPVDELFDVVVDSSEVGMRKPDPRIFLHTLAALGDVEPGRAVFLDDHPGNVIGAEKAGLVGIVVDDPAEAIAALDVLLADPA